MWLSAERWRFTASRLARARGEPLAPLSRTDAVREYWLGTFLNQVLPLGARLVPPILLAMALRSRDPADESSVSCRPGVPSASGRANGLP